MGFLHNLKLQYRPPHLHDSEFGEMVFMYIPNAPERSYWEASMPFPDESAMIEISLRGGEDGPFPESREFYRKLPGRFDRMLEAARPMLAAEFQQWMQQPLPNDIFSVLTLSGFSVDDPRAEVVEWDMMFETTGENWRAFTIFFRGDQPLWVAVDT